MYRMGCFPSSAYTKWASQILANIVRGVVAALDIVKIDPKSTHEGTQEHKIVEPHTCPVCRGALKANRHCNNRRTAWAGAGDAVTCPLTTQKPSLTPHSDCQV